MMGKATHGLKVRVLIRVVQTAEQGLSDFRRIGVGQCADPERRPIADLVGGVFRQRDKRRDGFRFTAATKGKGDGEANLFIVVRCEPQDRPDAARVIQMTDRTDSGIDDAFIKLDFQQSDQRVETFVWKASSRNAELAENGCCAGAHARIGGNRELHRLLKHSSRRGLLQFEYGAPCAIFVSDGVGDRGEERFRTAQC